MKNAYSKLFVEKFLKDTLKLTEKSWYTTLYYYMIDSQFRTTKRLDLFLKEQIDNPNPELVKVAMDLTKKSKTTDELIISILAYVYDRVKYEYDDVQFNKTEYWADAYTVWKNKRDDCDGLNSLIYVLARLAGITDLCLWNCIGDVKTSTGGVTGHYWLIYFSPRQEKWYTIDGTYYPNFKEIRLRPEFTFKNNKYASIWYLFNEQYIARGGG